MTAAIDRLLADREREFSDAAAEYARRGWPIFAVRPDKFPRKGSHGHLDAQITTTWPTMQPIAIATGAAGLVVLDIDPRNGGDEAVQELEREHGELPETPRALTPSGGTHFYFAGSCKSRNALRPGVDVKSEGGYVVAPPTDGYRWDAGAHLDDVSLAPAPAWLLELLKPPRRRPSVPRGYVSTRYARAALRGGWEEIATATNGARNATLNKVVYGWALRLRQVPDGELEAIALDAASRAGLLEREAMKTIAGAIKRARAR